jgi:molybdopterin converting factor small subunit
MRIQVTVPGLLRDCVGGRTSFAIDAETISHALEIIKREYPLLRVHVWDDLGELRQHVLIFHNDTALRWLPSLDAPLKEGDRLQIMQAVSGG